MTQLKSLGKGHKFHNPQKGSVVDCRGGDLEKCMAHADLKEWDNEKRTNNLKYLQI